MIALGKRDLVNGAEIPIANSELDRAISRYCIQAFPIENSLGLLEECMSQPEINRFAFTILL
jgi:hypothetical protein